MQEWKPNREVDAWKFGPPLNPCTSHNLYILLTTHEILRFDPEGMTTRRQATMKHGRVFKLIAQERDEPVVSKESSVLHFNPPTRKQSSD